jgi:hypothetical protein
MALTEQLRSFEGGQVLILVDKTKQTTSTKQRHAWKGLRFITSEALRETFSLRQL